MKQIVDSSDLWCQVWEISIEAFIRYSNISQSCSQHETHLITVLQKSIPLLEEASHSDFSSIIEKAGYLNALRTLAIQYKTIDQLISTKLSLLVHTLENAMS